MFTEAVYSRRKDWEPVRGPYPRVHRLPECPWIDMFFHVIGFPCVTMYLTLCS